MTTQRTANNDVDIPARACVSDFLNPLYIFVLSRNHRLCLLLSAPPPPPSSFSSPPAAASAQRSPLPPPSPLPPLVSPCAAKRDVRMLRSFASHDETAYDGKKINTPYLYSVLIPYTVSAHCIRVYIRDSLLYIECACTVYGFSRLWLRLSAIIPYVYRIYVLVHG